MNKVKTIFSCQNCGSCHPKWSGQCSGCFAWNTLVEEVEIHPSSKNQGYTGTLSKLTKMSDVVLQAIPRHTTGLSELDRVLGNGLIMGSAVLLGGDPGIGKSTLLLQTIANLSLSFKTLYVTGEESLQQVTLRAKRLGSPEHHIWLLADTNIDSILHHAHQEKPNILVIDSIQTMQTPQLSSAPGSVSQVKESAMRLVQFAKQTDTALFLVGHVTKDGHLAGPRVLEHMVDTVLYFEGEQDSRYRMIRAVKNRFGAVNELGIFAMTETGLKEVSQPSAIFLSRESQRAAGSVIMATKEGTRPLLVEVQALVDQSHSANPRRLSVGLDAQRLSMLLAILHKHTGIQVHGMDVYLNVVGGLEITEPAADLAALCAILSSFRNRILPSDLIVFGELGLSGEIRPVASGQERLKEAAKHGFKTAIVPKGNYVKKGITDMRIFPVSNLKEAVNQLEEVECVTA